MTLLDESFLRARLLHELTDLQPQALFELMASRLSRLFSSRDADAQSELIQLARVFVSFQALPAYTERCRDIFAADCDDPLLSLLIRSWFTAYPPYREGVPRADDQNAQLLISLPRGVQRARARQNHRGDNEALLRTPFPDVVEILCSNPSVRESDVLFMASRRPTMNKLLEPIFQSQWITRPNVRLALTANPYIMTSHAFRCAFTLSKEQLRLISDMNELHPALRAHAKNLLNQFDLALPNHA